MSTVGIDEEKKKWYVKYQEDKKQNNEECKDDNFFQRYNKATPLAKIVY